MRNELKPVTVTYTLKKDLLGLLALSIICLVTYWPLTFHVFSLKNDAINLFLPVRHLISESFYNGYFPFWSPYFNLGYPLHADMQSGVWNPVVQLFSLFGPYTLYTAQIETLLYILLGGTGMYFLLRHFHIHPFINIMCSAAYMLCGFNSDSGQFLTWTGSSAFIPFVLLFYYRLLQTPSFYNSMVFTFFLWLLFAIGYPGLFIITCYVLFAMFIVALCTARGQGEKQSRTLYLKKLAGWHLMAILIFAGLALPAILSYTQYLPLSDRGSSVSYKDAMSNPLHPFLAIAYIAPLSVFDVTKFTITDFVERNSFFGLFTFLFFLSAFFVKTKQKWITFCKYAFVISFLFSLGEWAGLRVVAYYILPMMKTFRHPAIAKIFSIIFAILLAAYYLQKRIDQTAPEKKHVPVFRTIVIIIAALGIWAIINSHLFTFLQPNFNNAGISNTKPALLKSFKTSLSFYDLMLVSILIQLPFLFFFYRFAIKKFNLKAIVYTSILNCIVHASLFTFFTIVKKDRAAHIQAIISQNSVDGYPYPSLTSSLRENSKDGMKYFKEVGSLNLYNKKIGRTDFYICPSNVTVQSKFWDNTALREQIMQYPFIYQPDTACMLTTPLLLPPATTQKMVFPEDADYITQINRLPKQKADIALTHFTPNSFHFTCTSKANTFLVLCQNRYPFWQVQIDGRQADLIPSNISFMGVMVPAGSHQVQFNFRARHITITWIISLCLTGLLLIYFACTLIAKRRSGCARKKI